MDPAIRKIVDAISDILEINNISDIDLMSCTLFAIQRKRYDQEMTEDIDG